MQIERERDVITFTCTINTKPKLQRGRTKEGIKQDTSEHTVCMQPLTQRGVITFTCTMNTKPKLQRGRTREGINQDTSEHTICMQPLTQRGVIIFTCFLTHIHLQAENYSLNNNCLHSNLHVIMLTKVTMQLASSITCQNNNKKKKLNNK